MGAATSADDRALLAQLWRVCEQLLHDPHYKTHYGNWLAQTLLINGTKDQRILDTAAGVGFPAIQLCDHGFTSVSCSDADLDLLWSLKRNAGAFAPRIPTVCVRWQDLPTVIVDHFDMVLCLDASIGFMDSWGDVGMVSGPDSVCRRVRNSYLFDKQDLIGFLTDIGFASVQEVATPDFFYEDAVMATKPEA